MITIDDKEYRNLQEQVAYLTEQLTQIKQSLGNALPDPIVGPTGATGATGPQGRTPKIGFGFGPLPTDSSFENGDLYIIRGNNPSYNLTKGDLYKKENNIWVLKLNLVGPQGPICISDNEVVANPDGVVQDTLDKIQIDGVIYSIYQSLFGKFVKIIDAPASTTLTDEQIADITNGVFINGVFLNYKNPVLFPAGDSGTYYKGIIMSGYPDAGAFSIQVYRINKTTKEISATDGDRIITLGSLYSINGQFIPDFPNNPENDKILAFNTSNQLVWQNKPTAGMTVYRHSVSCSVLYSGYSFNLQIVFYSTLNEALDNVDDLWSYLVNFLQCYLGDWLCFIKNKNANSIEIYDVKNATTILLAKSDFTFNSDTFNSI